ncbi:hypothetical protein Mapa_000924 [Marchantia paleacea]|nr:hypothetical protein Mapa_000924 [Marchantia paleacea]
MLGCTKGTLLSASVNLHRASNCMDGDGFPCIGQRATRFAWSLNILQDSRSRADGSVKFAK